MAHPRLALIVARARNGVIGINNTLPWKLRDDLKLFKQRTLGHPMIMGRKTWDSLGGRPLPGRRHVVVSRQARDADTTKLKDGVQGEAVVFVPSIEDAIQACGNVERAFVIGGAQIFAAMLPLVDALYITEVYADVAGDAVFPPLDLSDFAEVDSVHFQADEHNQYDFDVVEYRRGTSVAA